MRTDLNAIKVYARKQGASQEVNPGRKGNTLNMVEKPDIIEKHIPGYCNSCGKRYEQHCFLHQQANAKS